MEYHRLDHYLSESLFWEIEEEQFCGVVKASKWLLQMLVTVNNKLYKKSSNFRRDSMHHVILLFYKFRQHNVDWKYVETPSLGKKEKDCKR